MHGAQGVGEVGAGVEGHDDAAVLDLVEPHADQAADGGAVEAFLVGRLQPAQQFQAGHGGEVGAGHGGVSWVVRWRGGRGVGRGSATAVAALVAVSRGL